MTQAGRRSLRIVTDWRNLPADATGASVAMGNFDGVQLGHRQVIADAARAAAQKAFFDAAIGRSAAPSPQVTPQAAAPAAPAAQATRASFFAAVTSPPQRAEVRPDPAADPPARLLRPGSLLDIRV